MRPEGDYYRCITCGATYCEPAPMGVYIDVVPDATGKWGSLKPVRRRAGNVQARPPKDARKCHKT